VHYKVSRVNGDSYEEKHNEQMRLEWSSECWMIVNVSNCDRKTVPHVRTVYDFPFSGLFHYLLCDCLIPRPYTIYFILLWHDITCLCWKCRYTPIC